MNVNAPSPSETYMDKRLSYMAWELQGKTVFNATDVSGYPLLEQYLGSSLSHDQRAACDDLTKPDRLSQDLQDAFTNYNKTWKASKCTEKPFLQLVQSFTKEQSIKLLIDSSGHSRHLLLSGDFPPSSELIPECGNRPMAPIKPDFVLIPTGRDSSGSRYHMMCQGAPVRLDLGRELPGDACYASNVSKTRKFHFKKGQYAWESVIEFWSLKANTAYITDAQAFAECGLCAAEIFRHQFGRRFVNCFLLCGCKICYIRFDRSGACASFAIPVDPRSSLFWQCLLTGYVVDDTSLGMSAGLDKYSTAGVYSTIGRLVVDVKGFKVELGDVIHSPSKDHLISRGTTTFRARRAGTADEFNLCFKASWVSVERPLEAEILQTLHDAGFSSAVKCHAHEEYDKISQNRFRCIEGEYDQITEKFRQFGDSNFLSAAIDKQYQPSTFLNDHPGLAEEEASGLGHEEDIRLLHQAKRQRREENLEIHRSIHPARGSNPVDRELRFLVVDYVPHAFHEVLHPAGFEDNESEWHLSTPSEILAAWITMFESFRKLVHTPWVHRDLSFTNIRVKFENEKLTPVWCDWDIACPPSAVANAHGRTGTAAFMAIAVLKGNRYHDANLKRRWVHDLESAFWLCFLGVAYHSTSAADKVKAFQPLSSFADLADEKISWLCESKYNIHRLRCHLFGNAHPKLTDALLDVASALVPAVIGDKFPCAIPSLQQARDEAKEALEIILDRLNYHLQQAHTCGDGDEALES